MDCIVTNTKTGRKINHDLKKNFSMVWSILSKFVHPKESLKGKVFQKIIALRNFVFNQIHDNEIKTYACDIKKVRKRNNKQFF